MSPALLLAALLVGAILIFSELGWRRHFFHGELGRKFVHISVGTFVAFWPLFLSWTEIRLASLAFVVVVLISKYLNLFKVIHSVQRPTYGSVFFALTVGLLTFVTHSKGVYAAAVLQMSLADGLAAVVGTRFGRRNTYHLLGHAKSVVGTATFFVVSLAILVGYSLLSAAGLPLYWAFVGSAVASVLENLGALGSDNLLVPVFIVFLLMAPV